MLAIALIKKPWILMIVAACGFAAACSAIYSPEPVGQKLPEKPLQAGVWEDYWIAYEQLPFAVHVEDAKNGRLSLAYTKYDASKSEFRVTTYTAELRQYAPDEMLVSIYDADRPELHRWSFFGLLKGGFSDESKDNDLMMLWMADVQTFKKQIEDKKLPGSIDGESPTLGKLTPAMIDQITSPSTGLIDWSQPIVLKRLRK